MSHVRKYPLAEENNVYDLIVHVVLWFVSIGLEQWIYWIILVHLIVSI